MLTFYSSNFSVVPHFSVSCVTLVHYKKYNRAAPASQEGVSFAPAMAPGTLFVIHGNIFYLREAGLRLKITVQSHCFALISLVSFSGQDRSPSYPTNREGTPIPSAPAMPEISHFFLCQHLWYYL